VRLQLEVAAGDPLPPAALSPTRRGHAVEARLVAEDVPAGFLPSSGRYRALTIAEGPDRDATVRVDTGYEGGDEVSTYYDALLAKVIAWAPTRDAAAGALARALRRARLHGPVTNRDLLVRTLEHPEFIAGTIDTGFYERHDPSELGALLADSETARRLATAAAMTAAHADRWRAGDIPYNFRNVGEGWLARSYTGDIDCVVEVRDDHDAGSQARFDHEAAYAVALHPNGGVLQLGATDSFRFDIEHEGADWWVDSEDGSVHLVELPRLPEPQSSESEGSLHSPLPGTVVRVDVALGDAVRAGDPLVVLEAMKMEHTIRAPHDGVVTELDVSVGSQVETGAVLVVVGTGGDE